MLKHRGLKNKHPIDCVDTKIICEKSGGQIRKEGSSIKKD
jgi:hypothetical protein